MAKYITHHAYDPDAEHTVHAGDEAFAVLHDESAELEHIVVEASPALAHEHGWKPYTAPGAKKKPAAKKKLAE